MRFGTAFLFLSAALAGRVVAFSVNATAAGLGLLPPNQLLVANDTGLDSTCQSACSAATATINNCSDDTCFCSSATIQAVQACQQCFFTTLIEENRKMPNPLVGSAPVLGAYGSTCKSLNQTVNATDVALALPSNWDGPVAMHLSTGATVVYLISVLTLGIGLLSVIFTM